ncbi:general transcription factor II-I repeat domain-containing protein 2A [Trichonephila clavipes]|nr:general transcription factor II-I repeat domain-containing protein 2A [Trichonephila clavipes]
MDIMWLLKLMFFTDICQHFNELNIKLQGPNKTVIVMMDLLRAFEAKLYVFRNDIITKNYKFFPNLKKKIKYLDTQEKRNEEKVIDDFISIMDSLIKEFSARFSQFKELSETFKFIMYPDVISFDKLNLSQFDWLEIEELEMQLIDFQSCSIWIQKFIETRKKLELIEVERLTSNIGKNTSNEILETWNSIPDAFNCLKKLAHAILTIFSSTYARESLFSEINNIKDSLRNRLTDDSNSACILLKKKWHVDPKRFATPGLDHQEINKRIRHVQTIREQLRKRFRIEYLSQLREQTQHHRKLRPLTVGEVVVAENSLKNRNLWSLARVIQLIPGKDGHVRVARVKTETGELVRPVQRLYNLELQEPEINLPKDLTDSVIRTRRGRKVISPKRLTYA